MSNSKNVELDPMVRMRDALDAAGCHPNGDLHSFMAHCPAHRGSHRNLRVTEGSDGRVLLTCLAACDWRAIIGALGLEPRALFPVGHRKSEKRTPRPVKALSPGAAFMDNLTGAGYRWHATVYLDKCPYCDAQCCFLTVHDGGGVEANCSDGCHYSDVVRAVETRAAIAEAGVQL
jgi:hypothetical protein